MPFTLSSLIAATRGQLVGGSNAPSVFDRVEIDSRKVQLGSVFWALRGEHHDGHDFLGEVRQRQAAAAVVHRDQLAQALAAWKYDDSPLIAVADPLTALADFARWHRSQHNGVVIGVTGSYGKTTTREMIHSVLSAARPGVRSLKNFNNHIGLPLSLLELNCSHQFAVIEMGASAVGEIAALAEIAKPTMGVITGIGLAHVEGFGSAERITLGKGELLAALPVNGFAVLPADDPITRGMSRRTQSRFVFVGESQHSDLLATNVRVANQQLSFEVDHFEYHVPVTGRHFLQAALTAMAIAREFGMSPQQIADGFQNFQAAPGRCQIHQIGSWTVIDDSYNANPASMRAACETLRDWHSDGKRLLIIGDMLELGPHAEQAHYELGQAAAEANIDGLLIFGQQSPHVARGAREAGLKSSRVIECDQFEFLLATLDAVLEPNDTLLVKGSRGMRMERTIEWLRQRADNFGRYDNSQPRNAVQSEECKVQSAK